MIIEEKMLEVIKKIAKVKEEYKNAINQIAAYEFDQKIRKLTDELVGLYDELECRPAEQVAKTTEELAKDYAEEHLLNGFYDKGTEKAYTKGANDQRKIDIDKAMKAYCHIRCDYDKRCTCFLNPHLRCQSCETLIKAMEG